MAIRRYNTRDRGLCRWCVENRGADMKVSVDSTIGTGMVLPADAARLAMLRLIDGPQNDMYEGRVFRLSGLGDKTGYEAIRLDIATPDAPS